MKVALSIRKSERMEYATVKHCVTDDNNLPIGTPNKWAILDSRQYEVEYLDGTLETISANIITENSMSQVDTGGHHQCLLDEIIDHQSNDTVLSTWTNFYKDNNGIPC